MWRRVLGIPKCRFSTAAVIEKSGVDDFLDTISVSNSKKTSRKETASFESSTQFSKWLQNNKLESAKNYIDAARVAVNVRESDQSEAFANLNKESHTILSNSLATLSTSEAFEVLRFLIQLNPKSDLIDGIQDMLSKRNSRDLDSVSFETMCKILRYSNNVIMHPTLLRELRASVLKRAKTELVKPEDLIVLVKYDTKSAWLCNEEFVNIAEKIVSVMVLVEKVAFLKIMAEKNQRNVKLIRTIATSLSQSSQCLTLSQIQSITTSLAALTYYSPKVIKKVNEDLLKHSNVIEKWNDVLTITDSYLRLRMGHEKTWSFLIRWALQNSENAAVDQLARFVTILSKIGVPVEEGKPLAKILKPNLNREKMHQPNAWLNIVHSLAYFQELDENLADSVLNKNFVDNILSVSQEKHVRMRRALTLLSINGCAQQDVKNYRGPTISKTSFEKYGILFDSESIREARHLKYTKNSPICDQFLEKLFQIAPKDKYCRHSDIEEFGAFVDAYVLPEKETGRVVAIDKWSTIPRPVFFYIWQHAKQDIENVNNSLMGSAQLDLRLAKEQGYDPIIVYQTDLDYCATDVDKLNMLKTKIHSL